jgi:trk system potassium uptake protein TrkA
VYVVIVGGGRIGRYVARDLVRKGHEVTVIELEGGRVESLVAETGVLVIQGDAADLRYLEQAHTERADVFVATTHEDELNLVACQLARIEFSTDRVISRVNDPKNVEIFQTLGVEAVSSTRLISELIENEFSVGELIHLTSLRGGRASLVEIRIPAGEHAPLARRLDAIPLPDDAVIVAVFRGDETIIPRGGTEIMPGDEVIALTGPESGDALTSALLGVG